MATFNGAPYLQEQLDSLAAQSHLPSELVISDDGSTDKTLELVHDFAAKAPFPVIIHQNDTRLGYRANFFHTTTLCKSDLIAFSDQDDIWDRRKIEICLPLFDNPDVLLAYHNALTTTADGQTIRPLDDWILPRLINPPLSIGPWPFVKGFTQIFRRSVPFLPDLWATSMDWNVQERMAHDQWFFFLSSVLGSVAYVKEPLVYYRQHESNLVGARAPEHFIGSTRFLFLNFSTRYAHLEECARRSANILDLAKEKWNEPWQARASVGAAKYRQLAQYYGDRRTLYTGAGAGRRLVALINIFCSGGYSHKDRYRFGPKSLAKDALLGVALGTRLKKSPEEA